jgi:TolA-binding protein
MMLLLALITGCSSDEKHSAELLATARFEEKQGNLEHAVKLYAEILKKYPSLPAAQDATRRIAVLKLQKP